MTAAVLPSYQTTSLMSVSHLFGNNDRTEGYYQSTPLPHPAEQQAVPHSYVEQRQLPEYRIPNTASRDDGQFLHPRNSLPPLQPTSNYSSNYSSPTVIGPPSSHQRHHYGPISNSSLQTSPNNLVYVEHGPSSAYANTPYSGTTYSLAGSPDHVSSNQMMRAPSYHQTSPTSTLPSPYGAGGRSFYGYTSYNHTLQQQQQPNYVHSAGAGQYTDGRASISIPQPTSATTAYTRYSQPPTPQSAREQSSMYLQGYSTTAQVTTPRRAPIPSYHSMSSSTSKASPPSGNTHSTGAAPGPIPATTPVIARDVDGVKWIKFMYSKDKHKREYEIRCDTESVKVELLSPTFKEANLVYPRAKNRAEYTGNRWNYESECNQIGWALTHLNPELRENRGATQRAVDSWRNTCKDVKMRSRRVKRQTKAITRAKAQQQMQASQHGVNGQRDSLALAVQRPLPETSSSSTHEHKLPASSVDETVAQTSTPLPTLLPPPNSILTSPIESRYTAQGYHPQRNEYEACYSGQGYGQLTHGSTTYGSMMPPPPQAGGSLYSREETGYAGRPQ